MLACNWLINSHKLNFVQLLLFQNRYWAAFFIFHIYNKNIRHFVIGTTLPIILQLISIKPTNKKLTFHALNYFTMKKWLLGAVAIIGFGSAVVAQEANTLTKQEKKEGWKLLFDGKTTKGWHTYLKDTVGSKWVVKDGAIVFDPSKPKEGGGDIVTNESFENFELSLEWKISKGGNSGIIFDIQETPENGATYMSGPEMQVLDNINADDNKKQTHLAGCLYDMHGDATVSKPVPVGEWNHAVIKQNKGHLTLILNGITTYDGQIGSKEWNEMVAHSKFKNPEFANFAKVAKGKIALQEHPGSSQWRNIKIKLL
jgi:hypothetical protein